MKRRDIYLKRSKVISSRQLVYQNIVWALQWKLHCDVWGYSCAIFTSAFGIYHHFHSTWRHHLFSMTSVSPSVACISSSHAGPSSPACGDTGTWTRTMPSQRTRRRTGRDTSRPTWTSLASSERTACRRSRKGTTPLGRLRPGTVTFCFSHWFGSTYLS